jgi:threonine synthase
MKTINGYLDTRGLSPRPLAFTDVVIAGIAPGGGLFVPQRLPELGLPEVLAFASLPYWRRAAAIYTRFGVDVPPKRVDHLMQQAYGGQWADERIAPVEEVVAGTHVLELWHGPTSAFKDIALQCLPLVFSEAVAMKQERRELDDDFLVLVATSGDTGKAALEGFADRRHTNVVVFYPEQGVSDIQRKQMVTQHGDNVAVFGVRGDFDDCQSAVKAAFADEEFAAWLHDARNLSLSSANSINWGRLMPQIVYYVSAYADMVASGGVRAGDPIDVCVPTGNFGNILGAYYAKSMGVPIDRLICASNENSVLSDFIATGVYDVTERSLVTTPSPSMDILISSNLERLLYHLSSQSQVRGWMDELAATRRFQIDRATFGEMRQVLVGDYVTNDDSLRVIHRVWNETGYLLDPHTAVAWEVSERLRGDNPVLVVSTAHWAKFGRDVLKALTGVGCPDDLAEEYRGLSETQLLDEVVRLAPGCAAVPHALAALGDAQVRFSEVVDAGRDGVESAVRSWLT